MTVFALGRTQPVPAITGDTNTWKASLLRPKNLAYQFNASSDEAAAVRVQALAEMVEERRLSPEGDFFRTWDALFEEGFSLRKRELT